MKEKENTKRCVIYATYVGRFQYIRGSPSGWGRLLVVDKVDPPRPEGQRGPARAEGLSGLGAKLRS